MAAALFIALVAIRLAGGVRVATRCVFQLLIAFM